MWMTSDAAIHGNASRRGRPTQTTSAAPTPQPRTWISAVSSAWSLPALMSAFHDAWRRAAKRTAATTDQLSAGAMSARSADERAGCGAVEEMGERRRRESGLLGEVVPVAQHHRVARAGQGEERGGTVVVEDAALQCEAALRVRGQPRVVAAVDLAEVTLGVDVQLDRVEHAVREEPAQERQRVVLVGVVDAAQRRRLALVVEEMAEVVQQARSDERVTGVALLGQVRGLQRVLELRHRLAAVLLAAVASEQQLDVRDRQHAR